MCELNITALVDVDMWEFSHSVAEGGQSAGRDTWNAALAYVRENPILSTEQESDAVDWLADFGAWERSELESMESAELNALVLQFIAGNVREAGVDTLAEIDWEEYRARQEAGAASGGIYRADDGSNYYFSMCD